MAFRSRAKTPSGVLAAAVRLLKEQGWTQGGLGQDGARCLWLAIVRVVRGAFMDATTFTGRWGWEAYDEAYSEERNRLANEVETLLCERLGVSGLVGLWKWNDAPGRTLEQVIALLEGRGIPA